MPLPEPLPRSALLRSGGVWAAMLRSLAVGPLLLAAAACLGDSTTGTRSFSIRELQFPTNVVPGTSAATPATITAALYMPAGKSAVAAMVILPGSSGIQPYREAYYAHRLAAVGIAALIVDSFGSRGIESAVEDQTAVSAFQLENDAFAALAALRQTTGIRPDAIGVMGSSRGGTAALNSAFIVREPWRHTTARFALHLAMVPECEIQHRTATTTGAPIGLMLAELDDYAPAAQCMEYSQRITAAGGTISATVYEDAHHSWEVLGPVLELPNAENFSACPGIMEDSGLIFVEALGQAVTSAEYVAWARGTCVRRVGTHIGGGTLARLDRVVSDMRAFVTATLGK